MKPIIPFALLGALFAVGAAQAASTTPVGYVTENLVQGFNPIGLSLQTPVAVSGDFETVVDATLTDSDVSDFAAILPAGRTYILEITGGAAAGATQEFTTVSGSSITLPASIGTAAEATYQIRVAPTLEEVFGTTESVLKKNNVATNADNVWVPNGNGGYTRYFLNASGVWRNATTPGLAPNVPLIYLDGLFVEKKDPSAEPVKLTITGEVKKIPTLTVINQGFNLISTFYPAGTTLQNLGLEDDLKLNNVATNADNVWVPNGAGGYTRYFLNASGVWRNATTPGLAPADLALPSAVFIERKDAGSIAIDYTPPSSYASL